MREDVKRSWPKDGTVNPDAVPRWTGSDDYRDEQCARCGEVIGYAYFDARRYVDVDGGTVVRFTHRDRGTFEFPSWCDYREDAR